MQLKKKYYETDVKELSQNFYFVKLLKNYKLTLRNYLETKYNVASSSGEKKSLYFVELHKNGNRKKDV